MQYRLLGNSGLRFVPESQKRVVDNQGRLVHFGQFALNLPKPAGSA